MNELEHELADGTELVAAPMPEREPRATHHVEVVHYPADGPGRPVGRLTFKPGLGWRGTTAGMLRDDTGQVRWFGDPAEAIAAVAAEASL